MLSRLSTFALPVARSLGPAVMRFSTNAKMFCYQCEQTALADGACLYSGVCGKDAKVAALQDILCHYAKGISMYAHRARSVDPSVKSKEVDRFVKQALFSTLTNVNFDSKRFIELIKQAEDCREEAKALYLKACSDKKVDAEDLSDSPATYNPGWKLNLLKKPTLPFEHGVEARRNQLGDTVVGVQELALYGLKGVAAYAEHAAVLGMDDEVVNAGIHEVLDSLCTPSPTVEEMLGVALRVGEINLKTLEKLEEGHTTKFGDPVPTPVSQTPVPGKAIVVSGHDLLDLHAVLTQTEGLGINVYTHGEMLPGHGYPGLKQFPHLVGHWGGAWQRQQSEFAEFPGSVLMTTNCLMRPYKSYKNRIFTRSVVGWPGVRHLPGRDFKPLIEAALAAPGFEEGAVGPTHGDLLTGFGKNAVLSVADKVIEAVKAGDISHFFLIGGCDGHEGERSYFTDLAGEAPADSVILTLGCGKFRVNHLQHQLGDIGGIPRLLDMGQCNDSYAAVQVALALAKAFDTDVNSLPLSFALSWFEQKAVAVLLSLLFLNVRRIRLGPRLPAFLTQPVIEALVEKFDIKPVGDPKEDLANMLQGK